MKKRSPSRLNNQSGFIIADFLFSFVLVISCGILIFGLTFALATVEISQYIVWSTARNYSVGNFKSTSNVISDSYNVAGPFVSAEQQAQQKFQKLRSQFPLLTGTADSPWFVLDDLLVGDLARMDTELAGKLGVDKDNKDFGQQTRQPWIGARAKLELKLLKGFRIPFIGAVATPDKEEDFKFSIHAFVLRHPSQQECLNFFKYENRFEKGIQKLEDFHKIYTTLPSAASANTIMAYSPMEDNGC